MKKIIPTTMIALLVTGTIYSQSQKETVNIYAGSNRIQQVTATRLNLLSPANGQGFNISEGSKPIIFRWSAPVQKPKEGITYRLKVWQLIQGQNGTEAMRSNQPIVTKDVDNITQLVVNNIYTGPCRPPYLCDFIWAVELITGDDRPLYEKSNSYSFKYTGGIGTVTGSGGATVDSKILDKDLNNTQNGTKIVGDPAHGVDVKLGVKSVITQGDPIPSVNLNGLPPGVPWEVPPGTKVVGEPVHGVDIKPGVDPSLSENLNDLPPGQPVIIGGIAIKNSTTEITTFNRKDKRLDEKQASSDQRRSTKLHQADLSAPKNLNN